MKYIIGYSLLIVVLIWVAALSSVDKDLHIIACDVGQGDAFLITRGSTQILVDGGPNKQVLSCLGNHMPFWDRNIEIIILSHPQADHYTGLIEVFDRFQVNTFITSEVDNDTQGFQVLKDKVVIEGSDILYAREDQVVRTNKISLDIVHPTDTFIVSNANGNGKVLGAKIASRNLNDFSVVFNLHFDEFDALFTGDIGPDVIPEILSYSEINDIEYLKVPHHGSKNGLTESLLEMSKPEIAIISVGDKNRFGHPHGEVIDLLEDENVNILRTDLEGEVEVVTDGKKYWVR